MANDPTWPSSIPSEFRDIAASQLLLQPDAEYLWARHLYSAAMGAMAMEGRLADLEAFSATQNRPLQINGDAANMLAAMGYGEGGPLMLSLGVTFPGLVKFIQDAKKPGENVLLDRPVFIDGDVTFSNRVASVATRLFGTNSQRTKMEQISLRILETLGPTDGSGNLSPFSLPAFTLDRSVHNLATKVGLDLKRDRYRMLNAKMQGDVLAAAVAAGNITYQDTSFSGTSSYTASGSEPFTMDVLRRMSEALTSRKIPGVFGTRRYPLFLSNHQYTDLKRDPEFQRQAVFSPAYNTLFPGYIREVDDAVICVDITMPTVALGSGGSISGYQCIMMGGDAYGWGLAREARLLRDANDDGGRENRFGWNAYEGFAVLDDRFFQVAYTD